MITVNSPIVGKGGSREQVLDFLYPGDDHLPDVDIVAYLQELERLCDLVGFDFRILAAQSAHETDNWDSRWWTERLNPAGIGITGDAAQNDASQVWGSGTSAARGHIAHMIAYTYQSLPWPKEAGHNGPNWTGDNGQTETYLGTQPLWLADQRFYHAVQEIKGTAKVLGDLTGRWATDPKYGEKVAAKANQIFTEETPMTNIVFGRVPRPPIIDLICPKPFEGAGFYRVPPRQNVGVCEHITDGRGSVEFYHSFFSTGGERANDALVDFVIGRDGRIAMLNDWRGTRAPWANGNKLGMEGDGPAFYQRFGVEGIDQRLVSIEHEGRATEDWPAAMWNAAVALDAWLFDQMGVRHDSFPVHQDYGVVTHLLHSEFTNKGGNALDECPGRYLKQHITAFQNDVRAAMMAHQVVAGEQEPPVKPPVDITPKPFAGFAHGLATGTDQHDGDDLYEVVRREFKVAPGRKAQRRVSVGKDALIVAVLPEGAKVKGAFLSRQNGIDWLIAADGYAYQANAFNPKFTLPLRAKQQPKAA